EQFWANIQPWLKQKGYMLRSRYLPGWQASWQGGLTPWVLCEDAQIMPVSVFMDAIHIDSKTQVVFKKIVSRAGQHSHEAEMASVVSSLEWRTDPMNHCVQLREILTVPQKIHGENSQVQLLVMPFLTRWNRPIFKTVGEVVDFFQQTIEGLYFLHSKEIAHNDIKFDNIMMDSTNLYDQPVHPASPGMKRDWSGRAVPHDRTQRSVKYYYIDFAMTERYTDQQPRRPTWYGGDRTVPEFQRGDEDCDPFAVDVYRLGNVYRESITEGSDFDKKYRGVEFMSELIQRMTAEDTQQRPTMEQVRSDFLALLKGLRWWKLRSRVVPDNETLPARIRNSVKHWARTAVFAAAG
ncbi:hypothetical protein GYMLUDRAFT_131236, partial [Collybiopsis luxurians FD-317 M1]